MPPSPLNLPPLSPELKSMSPYLQRAEELKTKDPIMAYWCAYYAAQVGIGLKVKEPAARILLFELLGILERMKKEIGPTDAIDEESASSAFVENFALRVFSSADNEDRRGGATRATAKKFLAAANFLEILSIFESPGAESASSNAEKIRYAKWKAADIAKAFREGRIPTPGPAGGMDSPTLPPTQTFAEVGASNIDSLPGTPPATSTGPGLVSSPPTITRVTPPPPQLGNLPSSPFLQPSIVGQSHLLPTGFVDPRIGAPSPGAWSTAATPGSPAVFHFGEDLKSATPTRRAWVSEELEGREESQPGPVLHHGSAEISPNGSSGSGKQVRFSPSVKGDSSTQQPLDDIAVEDPFDISVVVNPSLSSREDALYSPSAPSYPLEYDSQFTPSAPSLPSPSSSPNLGHITAPFPTVRATSQTQHPYTPVPLRSFPPVAMSEAATITPAPPVALTPQVIAQIQKHCKFAISALDYEDAAQARKELREALKMLGG